MKKTIKTDIAINKKDFILLSFLNKVMTQEMGSHRIERRSAPQDAAEDAAYRRGEVRYPEYPLACSPRKRL
jgi:hypothetical protein